MSQDLDNLQQKLVALLTPQQQQDPYATPTRQRNTRRFLWQDLKPNPMDPNVRQHNSTVNQIAQISTRKWNNVPLCVAETVQLLQLVVAGKHQKLEALSKSIIEIG